MPRNRSFWLGVACVCLGWTMPALAQEADATAARTRPKVEVALGLGGSVEPAPEDAVGHTMAMAAFFATFGVGMDATGFELRTSSHPASALKPGRLCTDALLAVRAALWMQAPASTYAGRILRSATFVVGPSLEHVDYAIDRTSRLALALGGHVDLPLLPHEAVNDLRFRVGVRRSFGPRMALNAAQVGDSWLEVFGALATVF